MASQFTVQGKELSASSAIASTTSQDSMRVGVRVRMTANVRVRIWARSRARVRAGVRVRIR